MNKVLLDSNALIAAFDASHVDHQRAVRFLAACGAFYSTPQTQGAFLRFFTRPWTDAEGVRREPRMTTARAMTHLKSILNLPQHRFLPDDLPFDRVSLRSLSGFKQWNDAYLIALATKHGLKLATLERKLENMENPQATILLLIP